MIVVLRILYKTTWFNNLCSLPRFWHTYCIILGVLSLKSFLIGSTRLNLCNGFSKSSLMHFFAWNRIKWFIGNKLPTISPIMDTHSRRNRSSTNRASKVLRFHFQHFPTSKRNGNRIYTTSVPFRTRIISASFVLFSLLNRTSCCFVLLVLFRSCSNLNQIQFDLNIFPLICEISVEF